jgi:hypothetical protein
MKSYTFEIITKRRTDKNSQGNDSLYDIFLNTIVDVNLDRYEDIVNENEEGRLDLVSKRLYGTTAYVEELMMLNNIVNPFSITVGQMIYVLPGSQIEFMRKPEQVVETSANVASPKNKNTRKDPSRQKGVPPTIKPVDFEQVLVDRKNKTIRINNKLS